MFSLYFLHEDFLISMPFLFWNRNTSRVSFWIQFAWVLRTPWGICWSSRRSQDFQASPSQVRVQEGQRSGVWSEWGGVWHEVQLNEGFDCMNKQIDNYFQLWRNLFCWCRQWQTRGHTEGHCHLQRRRLHGGGVTRQAAQWCKPHLLNPTFANLEFLCTCFVLDLIAFGPWNQDTSMFFRKLKVS